MQAAPVMQRVPMSRIILDRTIVEDEWTFLPKGGAMPPSGKVIVALGDWLADSKTLSLRGESVGVWLDSHEDPAELADFAPNLPVIAVNFPAFRDGRGYSSAYLLRSRYGFRGELRAIGDVLRDQLFYLHRVGFNAFAIRADRDIEDALRAFADFSDSYQASIEPAQPLFRRRATVVAGGESKLQRLRALLARIEREFAPATFASSFGAEDMLLTDLIAREFPGIEIFSLNTGRLPNETLQLMETVPLHYGISLRIYSPEASAVAQYVTTNGADAFYESVDLRKSCCGIRKVEPLGRALIGKRAWLTGLRREQAASRQELTETEFDAAHGLQKFNPLIDWTHDEVWAFIRDNNVPYNKLHDRGYPSIGCEPCTRAVKPGEDARAGRWWWEGKAGQQECGLHVADSAATGYSAIPIRVIDRVGV